MLSSALTPLREDFDSLLLSRVAIAVAIAISVAIVELNQLSLHSLASSGSSQCSIISDRYGRGIRVRKLLLGCLRGNSPHLASDRGTSIPLHELENLLLLKLQRIVSRKI